MEARPVPRTRGDESPVTVPRTRGDEPPMCTTVRTRGDEPGLTCSSSVPRTRGVRWIEEKWDRSPHARG